MIPYSRLFLCRKSILEVKIIRAPSFRTSFFLANLFLQNNSVQTLLVCSGLDFSFSEISFILISFFTSEKRSIIFWLKSFFDVGDNLYLPAFLKVNDKSSLFPCIFHSSSFSQFLFPKHLRT